MTKLKIKDGSGDRDFFTMIPNVVLNHSSAIDRGLYSEMKRFSGESGKCFATEKTMMKRLQIGKKQFDKSLGYLMRRGWVEYLGTTPGKTRPVKTYRVNNIWEENTKFYLQNKKISSERTLSFKKISSESKGDKSPKQHKISSESNVEEEPRTKEDPLIKSIVFSDEKTVFEDFTYDTNISDTYNTKNKTLAKKGQKAKKREKELTDKQKKFLNNSELYQHFFVEASRLGIKPFEKESGGNAKMAKRAVNFLGLDEAKKLITQYLEESDDRPISFKAGLSEFNLVNFKSGKPISYTNNKLIAEE